ncbi:MAG: ABC transporter permease [Negativicutes bacterium]
MSAQIQYKSKVADIVPVKTRSRSAEIWRRLKKNRGAVISLIIISCLVIGALLADVLFDYETVVIKTNIANRLQGPSRAHFFGTDELGRDILARVVHGGRVSLMVGFVATLLGAIFGTLFGSIAGYYGGRTEDIIMRIADVFIAIPMILLAIVVVSAMGQSIFNLVIAIAICSVPRFIRVVRAAVMTVRNNEYVEAERAIGTRDGAIILFTVLPNCVAPILVQATLYIATAIISVSAMSFIGLGVPAPTPEWGSMLSAGRMFLRNYSYMTLFPGLAIMLTILSFNMLGDGFRDALDPKLKK